MASMTPRPKALSPGGMSLHNCMAAHGPDAATFEKASSAELKPQKIEDTLAFMFEARFPIRPTRFALETPALQTRLRFMLAGLAEAVQAVVGSSARSLGNRRDCVERQPLRLLADLGTSEPRMMKSMTSKKYPAVISARTRRWIGPMRALSSVASTQATMDCAIGAPFPLYVLLRQIVASFPSSILAGRATSRVIARSDCRMRQSAGLINLHRSPAHIGVGCAANRR